jgi:histidyl-tRNA synthetase
MPKDKPAKPRRPRAETPKGFRDYFGAEVLARQAMLDRITEVYRLHGFDPLESSAVETLDALGKYLPDVDRPNEGVFAWADDDDGWLALRYDLTAPLARVYAQHRHDLPTPTAATLSARSGATRSRGRAGSASSSSATPTPWARPPRPPTPRWRR